jgi:hypothetical protein
MKPEDKAKVQQALEALMSMELHLTEMRQRGNGHHQQVCKAITALCQLLKQPDQEPVAWMNPHGGFLSASYIDEFASGIDKEIHNIPLYTTPPAQPADLNLNLNCKSVQARLAAQWGYVRPATWVGLTDDEQDEIAAYHGLDCMVYKPAFHAIKAKLKEKNT